MRCAAPCGGERCGQCLSDPPPFERALAAVDYAYPWDGLIAALKFHHALDLAGALARLLGAAVRRAGAERPALLVPMPLGPLRLRERGYNQAWELARRVGRDIGCRADAAALTRLFDTPHQLSLPKERRAANVRGSFAARADRLRGASVALVDDVMTTGASAREAARALLDAGAAAVQVWVVARTPAPGD